MSPWVLVPGPQSSGLINLLSVSGAVDINTVESRYNDPRYNDIPGITMNILCSSKSCSKMYGTEPRYNDPRYNDIPDITMNILCPSKSYSKMYGREPRYNDLRYNDIPDITMRILADRT